MLTLTAIDDTCLGEPVAHGDHVYFKGGEGDQLWRTTADGSRFSDKIDNHCHSTPVIKGDYIYFSGGAGSGAIQQLYRRKKDGTGTYLKVDDNSWGRPGIANDIIFFRAWGGIWARDVLELDKQPAQVVSRCSSDFIIKDNRLFYVIQSKGAFVDERKLMSVNCRPTNGVFDDPKTIVDGCITTPSFIGDGKMAFCFAPVGPYHATLCRADYGTTYNPGKDWNQPNGEITNANSDSIFGDGFIYYRKNNYELHRIYPNGHNHGVVTDKCASLPTFNFELGYGYIRGTDNKLYCFDLNQ